MGLCRHKNKFNFQICLVVSIFFIDSALSYGLRRRVFSRQELRQEVSCPEPTGQFAHPRHCDRFLNCWDGEFHVEKCPAGLVFNEQIKACDWRRNVDCTGKDGEEAFPAPDPELPPNNEAEIPELYPDPDPTPAPPSWKPRPKPKPEPSPSYPSPAPPTWKPRPKPKPEPSPSYPSQPDPPLTPVSELPPNNEPEVPEPGPPSSQPVPPPTWKPKPKPEFGLKPPTTSSPDQGQGQPGPEEEEEEEEEIDQVAPSSTKPPTVLGQLKPKPQFRPSTEKPTDSPIEQPFNPPDSEISPPSEPENPPTHPGGKPETDPGFIPSFPAAHLPAWPSVKCPIEQGILPVSGHCDAVVVCLSGIGHLLRCPHGHGFNPNVGTCTATRDGQDCHKSLWNQKNYAFSSSPSSLSMYNQNINSPVKFVYIPQAVFSSRSMVVPQQQSLASFFNLQSSTR